MGRGERDGKGEHKYIKLQSKMSKSGLKLRLSDVKASVPKVMLL